MRESTSTRHGWLGIKQIVLLGALGTFGPLSIDTYLPSLPELQRHFTTGPSQAQLTISACLLGLALGQVVAGSTSDARGRRGPLLIGLAGFAVTSILCATAESIYVLIGLRFLQGVTGAAGIVIARAVVRDMYSGNDAARYFSTLMVVSGMAPILAPILGGQIVRFTSWRGVFVVLGGIGVVLLLAAYRGLGESLPVTRRRSGGLRSTANSFRALANDRRFLGFALSAGLAMAAMFTYIAGSPFVLQDIYGVSPQTFSLIFGSNALGIVAMSRINHRLIGRYPVQRLLATGFVVQASAAVLLLAAILSHTGYIIAVLVPLFVVVSCVGLIQPNAIALALADHADSAGSGAALLGLMQYVIGALAAPVAGIAGEDTAVPMGLAMAALSCTAVAVFVVMTVTPRER